MGPKWFLVAFEEYNHQSGHHCHLFIEFVNPHSKFKILKELQRTFTGRIQVDHGRGTFEECKKYLVDPDKDKNLDKDLIVQAKPPKVYFHNHTDHKVKKSCPRCTWLTWWKGLTNQSEFNEESNAPYTDGSEDPELRRQNFKYCFSAK